MRTFIVYPSVRDIHRESGCFPWTDIARHIPASSDGEGREYYRITDQGRHALEEVKPRLRDLVEEVLGHVGREGTDAPG